jgi:ribosome-binding protein aMBF1 (putative translation factor)
MSHSRWKTARERRLRDGDEPAAVAAARWEIKLAFDLGQAVHDRRTAHSLSQSELAARAGMTQPQVSKLELGATVPTLPLPARLAEALDTALNIAIDDDATAITFTPDRADAA